MSKEKNLYLPLKKVLEKFGWEVYTEVRGKYGLNRADIVAEREGLITVIEMKNTLTINLLEQAIRWLGVADYIFICIPVRDKYSWLVEKILKEYQIGIIEIDLEMYYKGLDLGFLTEWKKEPDLMEWDRIRWDYGVKCKSFYKLYNKNKQYFYLTKEHQEWSQGGTTKGYVTTYKLLMRDVYEYLRQCNIKLKGQGWKTSKEIWDYLRKTSKSKVLKHYVRPVDGIRNALKNNETDYIENKKQNNRIYFRIKNENYISRFKDTG